MRTRVGKVTPDNVVEEMLHGDKNWRTDSEATGSIIRKKVLEEVEDEKGG